jgi:hypothetical protein
MKKISLWEIFKVVLGLAVISVVWVKLDWSGPDSTKQAELTWLKDEVARLRNHENQARFAAMSRELSGSSVMKAAKKGDGKIGEVGQIRARMSSSSAQSSGPDARYKDPELETRNHITFDLYRDMANGKELPIGWVKYHPSTGEMTQFFYPLEYKVTVIASELSSGEFEKHVSAVVMNDYLKAEKGVEHPLKLSDVKFERRPAMKRFSFNPRIALGAMAGENGMIPALDMSFWSYGRTTVDMTWRFAGIGLGVSAPNIGSGSEDNYRPTGVIVPAQWNVGQALPLVENLFIGPVMTLDTQGGIGWGGQLSIPF